MGCFVGILPSFISYEVLFQLSPFVVHFLYYFVMESTTYRTIGKYCTGTRVVTTDGSRPSTSQLLRRTIIRTVPIECLSFIYDQSGHHDILSDTRAITTRSTR
ncbi:RDD family protein [Reichenbachiella sp. 5M10]|uniref:RDD family protein n=1 Tax=Reichenbachiella sp. 5M10 TaxID=1889772 RepID=UPI00117B5061